MPTILEIALPVHLYTTFDYLAPADLDVSVYTPGTRVKVMFNYRELIGIYLGSKAHSEYPIEKLKQIDSFIETQTCMPTELLNLCRWAAKYYLYPVGEVMFAALPKRLREGLSEKAPRYWQHTPEGKGLPKDAFKRAKKQQALHQALLAKQRISEHELKDLGITTSIVKALEEKGVVSEMAESPREQGIQAPAQIQQQHGLNLNEEQDTALNQLRYHEFNCFLLEGITGSGKTEVYMQAVARVLQSGRQALILIPEIGLSPQTIARFKQRFNTKVVELHSNVSEGEREANWCAARDGKAQIIIGTRLASLCPVFDLGIIIVDEEHDASYKQQDNFRYSARDLSIYRAKSLQIPIILGSATPSLETLNNALQGRYQHLRLTKRAGAAKAPILVLSDLRNTELTAGLNEQSLQKIQSTLEQGQQAMVFVNRRGFAPALLCHHCGWVADCKSCDARMTLHSSPRHLRCHHCDSQQIVPRKCPKCHNDQLMYKGLGTEQIEQALEQRFPGYPVFRIDRDSTSRKGSLESNLKTIREGKSCIVVGTQMLAKGHHLPDITLVVIVDADQGLMSADFRGTEKLGQLITQVAGRAGREDKSGTVLLQSHNPEHPLLELLLSQGYHNFARQLLEERKTALLPPVTQLAIFRAESKRAENAIELLELLKKLTEELDTERQMTRCLGPIPALIERVQDRYRYQYQISSANRKALNNLLSKLITALSGHAIAKRTRWSLDVDAVE